MSAAAKGAWKVNNESTPALQMHLERASTGDAEARQRLLELTRDRPGVLRRRENSDAASRRNGRMAGLVGGGAGGRHAFRSRAADCSGEHVLE
jgi:hypothetical protein